MSIAAKKVRRAARAGARHEAETTRKDRLTVKLSTCGSYPHADVVVADVRGPGADKWAESDQTVGGSSWERLDDSNVYAMPSNSDGLVGALLAEGYKLDLSEYSTPIESCEDCDCTDKDCPYRS